MEHLRHEFVALQVLDYLRFNGFNVPTRLDSRNSEPARYKLNCILSIVRTFWKEISHVFHLDPDSVSNLNILEQNSFFSGITRTSDTNDSGFKWLLDGFLKYNQAVNLNPAPSVEDLRKDVVTRIAANEDPVIRAMHLNDHCARIYNQAELTTCKKRSASERYPYV